MEEVEAMEHQVDLEKMLAHMRAEALKRGKDLLRSKMEDNVAEGDVQLVHITKEDAKETEPVGHPTHNAAKRQRVEGRQAKKVAKRPKAANPPDQAPAVVEAPRK
ncbi:hypothetical protein NDU88_004911 [Pleurodeles waltl]|uniref:Uncharacterized protein n=1 Tax=Pleurodeles waltl TaxID=8319 RepID=A0AAV7SK60_PLEWA|nr:hypothetical protein NDU88_004911 [Pleurodeles waltl]